MFKKYLFIVLFLLSTVLLKAHNFENIKVLSVYDGDTFKVNLPCTEDIFCRDISVRVNGIDTPEMKSENTCEKKKAKEAQTLTKRILAKGAVILKNCKRDKYFRLLCDVSVLGEREGFDLSKELLNHNLAVEYHGETKAQVDWCKLPKNKNQNQEDNLLQEIFNYVISLVQEIIKTIKNF